MKGNNPMEAKLVEMMDALMKAAQQIGMEGVRLWPQMVRITFLGNLASLLMASALVAAGIVGAVVLLRTDWDAADQAMVKRCIVGSVLLFIGVLAGFTLVVSSPSWLSGIFYPEARTVLDLASRIK